MSGKAPRAMSVVVSGSRPSVASLNSSALAFALITPPPTYRTGRLDSMIIRAAERTCRRLPFVVGLYPGRSTLSGQFQVISWSRTSFGMSTSTGPGRPVLAMWNASRIVSATWFASFTR